MRCISARCDANVFFLLPGSSCLSGSYIGKQETLPWYPVLAIRPHCGNRRAGGCVFFSALEVSKQKWREVLDVPAPVGEFGHH